MSNIGPDPDMCGSRRQGPCEGGGGIPLYWSREHTIGRFHPIAQKQKTDLNIPLGIGQQQSRDPAKTKAAGNLVAGSIGASRSVRSRQQPQCRQPGQRERLQRDLAKKQSGLGRAEPRLKPSKSRTLGCSPLLLPPLLLLCTPPARHWDYIEQPTNITSFQSPRYSSNELLPSFILI